MCGIRVNREDEREIVGSVKVPDCYLLHSTQLRGPEPVHPIDYPHSAPMYDYGRQGVRLGQEADMLRVFARQAWRVCW
jgi:hypothetical protein